MDNQSAETPRAKRKQGGESAAQENPVRVLCVDDHAVLVEGLKAQFATDTRIQCTGYLSSAENLLEEVARLSPDVVVLDIEMPGPDVFEIADRLRHQHPNVRFIFLSAHVRDGYLAAAYKCGAWGYFAKGDELEDIMDGIVAVAEDRDGIFIMGPKVKERCQPVKSAPGARNAPAKLVTSLHTLTNRELEVLRLIGKGMSRTEIAEELSRSAKTIDGHQERIMRKLGVESRSDLVRFAIREGLAEA